MKSIEHTISHSPRYCHKASKFSVEFQTEPKVLPLDSRKDVYIVHNILVLYGENLPQELQNDIEVKVGGINCMVLDVNKHSLSCNASTLMDFSKEHFDIYNTVYSSASTSSVTQNASNTVISSNEPEQQITRKSLITVTGPALKKPAGSAKKFSVPVSQSNEQFDGSPISRGTDIYVCYNVSVTIGNYHSDLGELKVYRKIHYDVHLNDIWTFGVLVTCSVLLLIAVIVILLFLIIKQKHTSKQNTEKRKGFTMGKILRDIGTEIKQETVEELGLDPNAVILGALIGSGNFGYVYEGTFRNDQQTVKVAVKTLKNKTSENIDLKDLILEAVVMKDFRHPNVLQLLGLVEKELGVPYVILPYMDNGDLLTYVRKESVNLRLRDAVKFGADIASGMAYLSSLKFVHRDLAERNYIFVSYSHSQWSFGVVLWELFTRGLTPYPGVDGWDIFNFLRQRRLDRPHFCPPVLYTFMTSCWAYKSELRPTFTSLATDLYEMIGYVQRSQLSPLPYVPNLIMTNEGNTETDSQTIDFEQVAQESQTVNLELITPESKSPSENTYELPESPDYVLITVPLCYNLARAYTVPEIYDHPETTTDSRDQSYIQVLDQYEDNNHRYETRIL